MDVFIYAFIGLGIMSGGALVLVAITKLFTKSDSKAEQTNQAARTTNCRDCNGIVSKGARKCPHCGANEPYIGATGYEFSVFIKFILFIFLFGVFVLGILYFVGVWGAFAEQQVRKERVLELFRYELSR